MTTLNRPVITLAGAVRAIDAAVAAAEEIGVHIVVSVLDTSGLPIAMHRMDDAPMLSIDVAADKAWTVASFGQPTAWWVDLLAADPSLAHLSANNRLMPVPGGVPIMASVGDAATMVGAIGVSGATGEQDHAIATAGADAAL